MQERTAPSRRGIFSRQKRFSRWSEWITCLVINTFFCLIALVLFFGVLLALALNVLVIVVFFGAVVVFFLTEVVLLFAFRRWRRERRR
jgi:amino acid transporter